MAVSAKDALTEVQWLSDRLSAQVRMVAVGLLAFSWGLLVSPPSAIKVSSRAILWVALLAVFTLVLDLLQYIFGYIYTENHRRALERTQSELGYDRNTLLYRLRRWCFWFKQGSVIAAFVLLAVVLIPAIV